MPSPPSVGLTLAYFSYGSFDPTTRLTEGHFWRTIRTSAGPALLHAYTQEEYVVVETFGEGQNVAEELAPGFIGLRDRPPIIDSHHVAIQQAHLKFGHLRLGASRDPFHELLPAVLGQRVTAKEAARQWGEICRRFGDNAPQAPGGPSLRLPPTPEALLDVPYWEFHRLGIEKRRVDCLKNVARNATYLDQLGRDSKAAASDLEVIPGVGRWTAAVAGLLAFGDSDALCVGDFHAKNTVAYALTGKHRGTDAEMCDLLAHCSPDRARVLRWLELAGWRAPAHGPRRRNLSIASL